MMNRAYFVGVYNLGDSYAQMNRILYHDLCHLEK